MKWGPRAQTKDGLRRVRTEFLFLPKEIKGEVRWLEQASWEEEYRYVDWIVQYWRPCKWIDNPAGL